MMIMKEALLSLMTDEELGRVFLMKKPFAVKPVSLF